MDTLRSKKRLKGPGAELFDVEAVRLLLTASRAGKREAREAVEIGALQVYDRPQPTTRNYDQLLGSYAGSEVIQLSVATVAVQQATIRQYAKQLQLTTVGGSF